MPEVRYIANRSYTDGTSEVRLNDRRRLVLGGPAVDLTDDQIARLQGRIVFEVVDEKKEPVKVEAPVAPTPEPTVTSGVDTGSAPETNPTLPTPDKGN